MVGLFEVYSLLSEWLFILAMIVTTLAKGLFQDIFFCENSVGSLGSKALTRSCRSNN